MSAVRKLILSTMAWSCIAIILAADAGQSLAQRLEGPVSVVVGILNVAIVLCLIGATHGNVRTTLRETWRENKLPYHLHEVLLSIAWLAALAWAGWLWTFGIRLLWLMVWSAVVAHKVPEETPGQEGNS